MKNTGFNAESFVRPDADYLRVMTASPEVSIGNVKRNIDTIRNEYAEAKTKEAEVLLLPELSLTGYSTADLFFNQHIRQNAESGISTLARATTDGPALIIGLPQVYGDRLFNCAALLAEGEIKGIVPKSFIPNYGEFYEKRWFSSGKNIKEATINIDGKNIPFGSDLLFMVNGIKCAIEICEDGWAPISPSSKASLNGALAIFNLSASNEIIGKDDYRRGIFAAMSGKSIMAYVYSSAGDGESNADVVYGGSQLIAENGRVVAERPPLEQQSKRLVYDLDCANLIHDRLQNKTFADQAEEYEADYRLINVTTPKPNDQRLLRNIDPHPYVPSNPETLSKRCEQILSRTAQALAQRIKDAKANGTVIGLSGGLDSFLTLCIAREAMNLLDRPISSIRTVTMPGPASSNRTQDNASELAKALGTTHSVMPIDELSAMALQLIGHDGISEDVTYENTQARMRTLLLMNYANASNSIVQGSSDMSELTQGWCSFNGDHMSMYNPLTGIPKTLVKQLAGYYVANHLEGAAQARGQDIVDSPYSPELKGKGDLSQHTEDLIGPYELHDFFDYHKERFGASPAKIGYLAKLAFESTYSPSTIARWLNSFLVRDTLNQWKMETIPNGPKIGSVAKSPRGDRRIAPNTSPHWYL